MVSPTNHISFNPSGRSSGPLLHILGTRNSTLPQQDPLQALPLGLLLRGGRGRGVGRVEERLRPLSEEGHAPARGVVQGGREGHRPVRQGRL